MMKRFTQSALLFVMLLLLGFQIQAQNNIAPLATASASTCNTGPCSTLNDQNYGTCGTQQMWISTSSPPSSTPHTNWIDFEWTQTYGMNKMTIHHAQNNARFLTGADLYYWNGSSWVYFYRFSNLTMQCINTINFPLVITNKLRITTFQMTGTGQTSNPNFREIEIFSVPLSGFDVAMENIVAPPVLGVGSQNLTVRVCNKRADTIYKADLGYQVDNNTPVTVSNHVFNPPIDPGQCANYTFSTPIVISSSGNYTIKTWITDPNDSTYDNNTSNDTLVWNACTGIQGTFTIGSTGDYSTVQSAVNALYNCGVAGPVTFNIQPGTYTERVVFNGEVIGASETSPIIFDGLNKSNVTIAHYGTSTSNRAVIVMNGVDHITFKNVTVSSTSSSYGMSVFFTNSADYNTFYNCNLEVSTATTSSNVINVIASNSETSYSGTGNNANFNTIENCYITGGYYGVRFNGSGSTSLSEGNKFINNDLYNVYYYGMYLYYQKDVVAQYNSLKNFRTTSSYGLYVYYSSGSLIDGNDVNPGRYGIYMYRENYYFQQATSQVTNNMVYNFGYSSYHYGLRIYYYCYNVTVANNTIWHTGTSSSTSYACLYAYYPYYCDFRNNILVNTGNSTALYEYNSTGCTFDYNLYYTNHSTYFVYWSGTTYSSLAAWKTSVPTQNIHSWEAYPSHLISSSNPHISATAYRGQNVGIDHDIDGDCRTPYGMTEVGADNIPVTMTLDSVFATKPDTSVVFVGMNYAKLLRVQIAVTGCQNPLSVGSVYFSTNGSTNTQDIENVRFFSEDGAPLDINNELTMIAQPNGVFSITAPPGTSVNDVGMVIAAYDVSRNATIGNFLDMTFDSIEIGGIMRYPSHQPVGKRQIVHPANYNYCTLTRVNAGAYDIGLTRFKFGNDIDNSTQILQAAGNAVTVYPTGVADVFRQVNYDISMYHGVLNNRDATLYIDLNNDGYFGEDELIAHYNDIVAGSQVDDDYTIPCDISSGLHRMRVIVDFYTTTPPPCGSITYGEAEDYFINVIPEGTPTVSYTSDTAGWVGGVTKYNPVCNMEGPIDYIWDYGDGSPLDTAAIGKHTYTQAGNFTVTVRAVLYGCDSTYVSQPYSDTMKIIMPTAKPDANFISNINVTTTSIPVWFTDLSTLGPYEWKWIVEPAMIGNKSTHTITPSNAHQNVSIDFHELGKYTVTLIATNVIGTDTIMKQDYIQVVREQIMCVDNQTDMATGYLYDDGGKDNNYSDPTIGQERTCSFLIEPKCATSISFGFLDFNVSNMTVSACANLPGDGVKVYDGKDNTGTPLHLQFVNPISQQPDYPNGFDDNQGVLPPGVTATSGSMYVEFYVNCGGVGTGFEAKWNAVTYVPSPPVASVSMASQIYTGLPLEMGSTSTGEYLDYAWDVDGDGTDDYFDSAVTHTYLSAGTYSVRLIIYSCNNMTDTVTQSITVIDPPNPPSVDFTVDYPRLTPQDVATFMDLSHESVTSWTWEITPNTFSFVNNTSTSSQNPMVQFHETGLYTVKLTASNYLGSATETKTDYIFVYEYCKPAVANLNPDIGMSTVLLQNVFGDSLIYQTSSIGDVGYTDYSLMQQAALTKGGTYTITLKRNTTFNTMNRSVWIDYNKDGIFSANEEVAYEGQASTLSWTDNFTVPTNVLVGLTRMRVGTNIGVHSNEGCGPHYSGEFEDYGITINVDETKPIITLVGSDTQIVNSCATYSDPGYSALDDVNGDLTSMVVVTGGPVITFAPDTFYLKYNVSDVANNAADEVTRVVIVLPDVVAPEIVLIMVRILIQLLSNHLTLIQVQLLQMIVVDWLHHQALLLCNH